MKNILRILTLTCDQSAQLMSKSQEAPLSRAERYALGVHLLICRSCRKYKKQLETLRAVFKKTAQPHTRDTVASPLLDDEQARALQERISKRIRENLDSM